MTEVLDERMPIGVQALLGGAVEGARLEFKATWDEATTGPQLVKTLCAFANDLQNLNGGYVVLGDEEKDGVLVRPVPGLEDDQLDRAQKWIRGHCNRIEPIYMPVMYTPRLEGRRLLVLWAPASNARPHQAPDGDKGERKYWVRIGSETVAAKEELLTSLMQQTARVPFDDRRAFDASNEDLRLSLVREFLHDVGSELKEEADAERVYSAMMLTARTNGHTVPRNVGLLFFSDDPQRWFRGARIELVEFTDDAGGDTINERTFKGPLERQLRDCLSWLESMTMQHIHKQERTPAAKTWASYPFPALREALVNAVYHRSYEADTVEPTKVYLYPNRVEVISYPGPVEGIKAEHLQGEKPLPPVQARNRRIGELLKELKLAEARGTGLPKMRRLMERNGSPAPTFDFDEKRTYFRVTLPAHPEYVALKMLRDHDYHLATGDDEAAAAVLDQLPTEIGAILQARANLSRVLEEKPVRHEGDQYLDAVVALAREERHRGAFKAAHATLAKAGEQVRLRADAASMFAGVKLALATDADPATKQRLAKEALALLEHLLTMDMASDVKGDIWFEISFAKFQLGSPKSEVVRAMEKSVELRPDDPGLAELLQKIRGEAR